MRLLWKQNYQEEEWGFLLIDKHNMFNEENYTTTLWAVCHKWPSGTRFAFNCYRHWSTLGIREGDGTGHLINIKEGVNQGDPLAMIKYGLGILPLIWDVRASRNRVTQPWNADGAGAGEKFTYIRWHLDDLMTQGTLQG